MKNLEAKKVVTKDKYAYMNADTFREFLKLYPYENNYKWAETLLKWLIFTYIDNFEIFSDFTSFPHQLLWGNDKIDICGNCGTLDFVYDICYGIGDRYYIGDKSATLNYERWMDRKNTIAWIGWHWFEDDIVEPLLVDRDSMTEDDKREWENAYYNMAWVVWRAVDDGKTEGSKIIDAIYSSQCILIAILDWTEKNADKLQ